jgi:hypothetical protein
MVEDVERRQRIAGLFAEVLRVEREAATMWAHAVEEARAAGLRADELLAELSKTVTLDDETVLRINNDIAGAATGKN